MQFTEKFQLIYTRYADDLTFSSDVYIEEEVIQNLLKIIHDCGFATSQKPRHNRDWYAGINLRHILFPLL